MGVGAASVGRLPWRRAGSARISPAALRFWDRLGGWEAEKFTTTEAVKRDRKSKRAIAGWLNELSEAGGVEQLEPSRGSKPATWKFINIDRSELAAGDCGLPEQI